MRGGKYCNSRGSNFPKKKKKAIDETVSRDEISKLLMNFKQVTYKYYLHFYDFFNTERCIDYKRLFSHY